MAENVVSAMIEGFCISTSQDGFSTLLTKITPASQTHPTMPPGVLHRGTYFLEQSCISIKFRYNTNKDYFLILYFIRGGDGLWQERRILMRRGHR